MSSFSLDREIILPVSLSHQTFPYPLNSKSNSPYRNGGYSSGVSSTQRNEYQRFPHHGPKSYFDKFSQGLQWSNPSGQSLSPQQSVLLYGPQSQNLKASTQKTPESLPLTPWEVEQSKNTSQGVDNMKGPPIYDSNVRTIIPPPPTRHNQRQLFFQQQQQASLHMVTVNQHMMS